ncbi:hypothetical protein [Agrobacterium tumefaciens]|uniref:hypothetical protein n=1 Tax=Agrobacterium tumefaciens TaxID=358 RepID=UPI001573FD73|nr:hypothetical protein [Agrobacterium tumefaciens]NSX93585.1 hypothetical protein [Agrobacterium tumefaciens]
MVLILVRAGSAMMRVTPAESPPSGHRHVTHLEMTFCKRPIFAEDQTAPETTLIRLS